MARNFHSWWRDPALVFYNKYYEPDEEVSQFMRENCEFIGIFFGAFRNKSTKHFVTYLNKFYRYMQQRDEPFDIIYLPLDEDEAECDFFVNACMEEWLVVPWGNQNLRRNVRNLYNVLAQPWLVIVKNDDEGTVVSYDGKTDLFECGYFSLIEWKSMYKKVLLELSTKDKKKKDKEKEKEHEKEKPKEQQHPDKEKVPEKEKVPDKEKVQEPEKEKEKEPEKEKEKEPEKESESKSDSPTEEVNSDESKLADAKPEEPKPK